MASGGAKTEALGSGGDDESVGDRCWDGGDREKATGGLAAAVDDDDDDGGLGDEGGDVPLWLRGDVDVDDVDNVRASLSTGTGEAPDSAVSLSDVPDSACAI
jgi:hypothetical protein